MERVAEEVFADYEGRGVTGRPLFWRRDRAAILRDLSRFLDEDAGLGTTPLRTELRFGPPDPVVIDLPGGALSASAVPPTASTRGRTGVSW